VTSLILALKRNIYSRAEHSWLPPGKSSPRGKNSLLQAKNFRYALVTRNSGCRQRVCGA